MSIIKAIVIWGATQAIQDMLRSRSSKVLVLPVWIVGLALVSPSLAFFLAAYLLASVLWAIFYRLVWGQNDQPQGS